MPTFSLSPGFGFLGLIGSSVGAGSTTTAGEAGLGERRPDWPSETSAQLNTKIPIRIETIERETLVVYDMRFSRDVSSDVCPINFSFSRRYDKVKLIGQNKLTQSGEKDRRIVAPARVIQLGDLLHCTRLRFKIQ
jgi:hypothetical protein